MASTLPSVSLQGGLSKSSSEPACRICAEVSRKVLKAIEEGPHDTYGLGWDQPEFDRIDLGNQTAFKSRLGCATCQNLMWYFKVHQKAGLKINSITHHLVISIQLSPMHLYFGMENCWGPYWTGSKGMVIKLVCIQRCRKGWLNRKCLVVRVATMRTTTSASVKTRLCLLRTVPLRSSIRSHQSGHGPGVV